jgi:hypothetical protein
MIVVQLLRLSSGPTTGNRSSSRKKMVLGGREKRYGGWEKEGDRERDRREIDKKIKLTLVP